MNFLHSSQESAKIRLRQTSHSSNSARWHLVQIDLKCEICIMKLMYSLSNKTVLVAVKCTHMHIYVDVPLNLCKHMQLNDQHVQEKSN